MSTITKMKKMITMQKLSFVMSCAALVFSIVAFMVANKANYGSMEYDLNRSFQPIGNVQDVEIIKADGSVEKLNAVKSQDRLSEVMTGDKTNKQRQQNNNGVGIDNDAIRQTNKIDANNKVASDNKNIADKTILVKETQKVQNKQQKNKTNATAIKNTIIKTQNVASPVARQNSNQNNATSNTLVNKVANSIVTNEKPKSNVSSQEKAQQQSLIKGIVIQIGSFKEKTSAEKQCKKMDGKLDGKECKVGTFGDLFGSLIVPFKDIDEARAFDKNVLNNQGIYGYIKNIS